MQYNSHLNAAEAGGPAPRYEPSRDREWVVVAYLKGRTKPLGSFRAQSSAAAIGLAKQRHPKLKATFQAELARGHLPQRTP